VAFLHYRNDRGQAIPLIPEGFSPQVELWYGAIGVEKDKKKDWNICRNLGNATDVQNSISVRGLNELLQWTFDRKCDPHDLPTLLKPRPAAETLPALSILCQGYLAGFAHSNSDQHSDDLDRALDEMQFSQMPDDFVNDIAKRFTEIRQKTWWRSPFGETNITGDARREAQGAGCSEIPKPILDLLKAIEEGDGQQTLGHSNNLSDNDSQKLLAEADLVAKAFCEVEKLLLKRSNELLRPNEAGGGASNTVTQGKRAI
jgi:hypothetical protein